MKRAIEPALSCGVVERVVFYRPNLRFTLPPELPGQLEGRSIVSVQRRGKYITAFSDAGDGFVLHLGMSGVIRIEPHGAPPQNIKHDHVEIVMRDGPRIVFNDPRRFGFLQALQADSWAQYPAFEKMGPEPLGNDFSGPILYERLKGRKGAIKAALLNQAVVAGVGNIYACEALFATAIDPWRAAADLSAKECEDLAQAVKDVLRAAIEAGGSSLKDYKHTDGALGYFQHHFKVYDRAGQVCPRCNSNGSAPEACIEREVQNGRSTFYCVRTQK